jgi:prevent-host-death family protein
MLHYSYGISNEVFDRYLPLFQQFPIIVDLNCRTYYIYQREVGMIQQLSLREMNQHFADYIKQVENGDRIILTRHGKPVARIVPISEPEGLTPAQIQAQARMLRVLKKGFSLKNEGFNREDLYE